MRPSSRFFGSRRVALPSILALLASALVIPLGAPAQASDPAPITDYAELVDPFMGAQGDHGQDGPGAIAPFGLTTVTPTTTGGNHTGYDYGSGRLLGFTNITLAGVGGGGAAGDILVSPTYQTYKTRPTNGSYEKEIRKNGNDKVESALAGYYQVGLTESGKEIDAQVTSTTRTGVHDYAFANAGQASLVVDLRFGRGGRKATDLKIGTSPSGNTTISGSLTSRFYNSDYKYFFYLESTVPAASVQTWNGSELGTAKAQSGTDIGAILNFNATAGQHIGMRVTVSPISAEQAKRDAAVEVVGKSFDEIRTATKAEWNDRLGKVEVEASTTNDPNGDLKVQLYTHLYRMANSPLNATSTDGTYRGLDGVIYKADGYTHYDSWAFWDDFHKYAGMASVYPDVYPDVVQSVVDLYATLAASGKTNVASMLHAVPTVRWERAPVVVADAISKGVSLRGLEQAYPTLKAQTGNPASLTNLDSTSGGLMGYSYDAYGMSVIAEALGKTEEAAFYLDEAARWAKVFDKDALANNAPAKAATGAAAGVDEVGMIMHRTSNSDDAPFNRRDPESWSTGLYQGSLWQYNWYDAQDLGGMINVMGGKEEAAKAVNYFFGNHVPDKCERNLHNFGNEISLHAPFLFNYVGQPSQTQSWTYRTVTEPVCADGKKQMVFQNHPKAFLNGMDNDAGTMSGYFISSALGLYPVMTGGDTFQITSPIFDRSTINLPGGKKMVIEAPGVSSSNYFIQSVTFNGQPLDRTWLTSTELNAGGVLHFTMGANPSQWGVDSISEESVSDHVSSSLYYPGQVVSTSSQVFNEASAGDGSIDTTITVTSKDSDFSGADGADLTSKISVTGVPTGLTAHAKKTGARTLALTLTGKATNHLVDDSTDGVVVTLGADAFTGTAPSATDRELTLKVRFAGYGVNPSATEIVADQDGVVDSTIDVDLTGGAQFAGATGTVLPSDAASLLGLPSSVNATITKTGDSTLRLAFSGTLTQTSPSSFLLSFTDSAFAGGVSALSVSGPGLTAIAPFTISPASTTRAELQELYDNARLITRGNYSAASFAALRTSVEAAKVTLADQNASEYALYQNLASLRGALDGLKLSESSYRVLQAEDYELWSAGQLKTEGGGTGTNLGGTTTGSWVAYQGLDFSGSSLESFLIAYAHNPGSASGNSKMEIRTGSAEGPLVTTINLPTTGGWGNYTHLTHDFTSEELAKLSGKNDIYMVFIGTPDKAWVANFDYFQFLSETVDDGEESFEFTRLTPNNVTTVGPGLGRDGSTGDFRNFANTHNEEWAKFADVDFGPNGADTLSLSYDKPNSGSSVDNTWIDLRLGSETGPTVASSPMLARTGSGWGSYNTIEFAVDPAEFTGVKDLFVVFRMDPATTSQSAPYVGNFAWFEFGDSTHVPEATEKKVEFESIQVDNGPLDNDPSLVAGEDFENGTGSPTASQNRLKTENGNGGRVLGGTTSGAWVRYPNVDLEEKFAGSMSVLYDAPSEKASNPQLEVFIDSMDGEPLVTIDLPTTGSGWGTYKTVTVPLPQDLTGNHTFYVKLLSTPTGALPYVANLDSFSLIYGVDKNALREAVAEVAPLTEDSALYLAADFAIFSKAFDTAEDVIANADATEASVASALRNLNLAADQLEWKVSKQLQNAITRAEAVQEADFTASSWTALQTALAAAKALDASSTHDAYSAALADLNAAYDGLVEAGAALEIDVTVKNVCVAGKAYAQVRAVNKDSVPVAITLETPYGSKKFPAVAPGANGTQAFNSRLVEIPAGTATVTATGDKDGQTITTEIATDYPASSCR